MIMFRSIAVLLFVWVATDAVAHTPGACDTVQPREQRIACYDVLFPPRVSQEASLTEDSPKEPPAETSTTNTPLAQTPSPVESIPVEVATASAALTTADQPAAESPVSAEDQFGREQLERQKGVKREGPSSINSKITSIKKRARQEMVFYLENGQVWLQVTARFRAIKEGAEVTINKARLGGYILTAENGVSTRVKRLR